MLDSLLSCLKESSGICTVFIFLTPLSALMIFDVNLHFENDSFWSPKLFSVLQIFQRGRGLNCALRTEKRRSWVNLSQADPPLKKKPEGPSDKLTACHE